MRPRTKDGQRRRASSGTIRSCFDEQLTEDERMIRDAARAYAQEKLLPRVVEAYREERIDRAILNEMGELGLLGVTLPEEYGGAGASYVAYGLIAREIERVDSGYRSHELGAVLAGHVPDLRLRRREQRKKYLPKLATGEWVGCFGLTEPDGGSDPGGMKTRAEKVDGRLPAERLQDVDLQRADRRRLRGLGQVGRHDDQIRGFILEKGMKGLSTPKIGDKLSLRASITGEIVMDDVVVPESTLLPNVSGLKGAVRLPEPGPLRHRLGRAWARPRSAATARGNTRSTASCSAGRWPRRQLVQKKLADMQTEIALGLQGALRARPADRRGRVGAGGDLDR